MLAHLFSWHTRCFLTEFKGIKLLKSENATVSLAGEVTHKYKQKKKQIGFESWENYFWTETEWTEDKHAHGSPAQACLDKT